MQKYTPEQLERHRNRQRAYARRSMSDAEFERMYNPQAYRDAQLLEALQDLTHAVNRLAPDFQAQPERPWRPSRPAPTIHPLSGPIQVQ